MKVFVGTSAGQGGRASDFSWTVEGELVMIPPLECGRDGDDIDSGCGCRRAMGGLASDRATTTFKVADLDIGIAEYEVALAESLRRGGWTADADVTPEVRREDAALLAFARGFPLDWVLERRGGFIQIRAESPAV